MKNVDDVVVFTQLVDELLCATKNYSILKKLFWNVSSEISFKITNNDKKGFIIWKWDLINFKLNYLNLLILRYLNLRSDFKEFIRIFKHSDLFVLLISTLERYLPYSVANLRMEKGKQHRLQELEYLNKFLLDYFIYNSNIYQLLFSRCCITIVECLTAMLSETEFFDNRNEILKYDK